MKFQKFVKALGSNGVIFVRKNNERWLASTSVFMRIPGTIRSITASDVVPMPDSIESIINYEAFTDPCELHEAVMPFASAAIKDCIRVFATENTLNKIAVRNNDYALIERGDLVEVYIKTNAEDETSVAKALVIKEYPVLPNVEPELVGIIFPADREDE